MTKSVHYRRDENMVSQRVIDEASESLMIVAPHVDGDMLNPLFALSRPIDVNLLTSHEAVKEGGRELRDHIKQLQDINKNVDVRVTDESFPAFTIVDGEHLHCHSRASKQMAEKRPDNLVDAAESLWARSTELASDHLGDPDTLPSG
ncbi:MAG: hypothetical protein PVJ49_11205 [Acidobacteriota bacterium]